MQIEHEVEMPPLLSDVGFVSRITFYILCSITIPLYLTTFITITVTK